MNLHFLIRFVLIVRTLDAIISRYNELTVRYHLNFKQKCQTDKYRIVYSRGVPIYQCIRECGLRNHCAALNFWRLYGICELFSSTEEQEKIIINRGCIHMIKHDINIKEKPCDGCSDGQTCDTTSRTCVYKECSIIDNPTHGEIFGNINKIGAVRRQICKKDYNLKGNSGRLVCLPGDQWNVTECIRVSQCGTPFIMNASVVLNPPSENGTYTATVTCNAWFQTRKNKIACLEFEEWEKTTCEDCYLDSPQKYTGKRNTTVTGMPCSRWDSPAVMQHDYTDLRYFPESSLSEAENYCRNPSKDFYEPWCYIATGNWEYCDIEKCVNY